MQRMNIDVYIEKLANALSMDATGLIKTPEQLQAEQQQQQQAMQQQQQMQMQQEGAKALAGAAQAQLSK